MKHIIHAFVKESFFAEKVKHEVAIFVNGLNFRYWIVGIKSRCQSSAQSYLIIVIFFTLTQFLENKSYTEKRQFFALNL